MTDSLLDQIQPCEHLPKCGRGACANCYNRQRHRLKTGLPATRHCKACGLPLRPGHRRYDRKHPECTQLGRAQYAAPSPSHRDVVRAQILELLQRGESDVYIMRTVGCSQSPIKALVDEHKIIRKKGRKRRAPVLAQAQALGSIK